MSSAAGQGTPRASRDAFSPSVRVETGFQSGNSSRDLGAVSTGPSSHSASRGRPSRDAQGRAQSRLASSSQTRTGSLDSVNVDKANVEIDLTNSEPGHGRAYVLPAVRSLQNVRNALHRFGRTDSSPRGRDSLDAEAQRQTRPLFRFMSRRLAPSDDLFRPIDPYRTKLHLFTSELEEGLKAKGAFFSKLPSFPLGRIVILQIYRHMLLRLPSMYFTRISRLFEEAEVTLLEIQGMIDGAANGWDWTRATDWNPANASPALICFKRSWEEFIEIVIQEWKTLNVVSVLLLGAVMTMFQIDDAESDGFTRSFSLVSLVFAAWSLIYGGVYIIRFRTMRSMRRAARFAQEAQQSRTNIFWNVWVLFSLPAVWLAWSMITFFAAIMSFVWTSGSSSDNPQNPPANIVLIPRIIITVIFALGLVYFILIIHSFRSYSEVRRYRPDGTAQDLALHSGRYSISDPSPERPRAPGGPRTNGHAYGSNYDTDLIARGYSVPQVVRTQSRHQHSNNATETEKSEPRVVGVENRGVDDDGVVSKGSPGIGGLDL